MLESVKLQRRQSEIRQQLAGLVGKDKPTDDEVRNMEALDAEYRTNETRYRAALIAEDQERRDAKDELETRGTKEWNGLIDRFEVRQVVLALDEGAALSGATAEVVQEMRSRGGYRGVPVPLAALERRTGETVASGVMDPISTRPAIDRLMPQSCAARMGTQLINIDSGLVEWPVVTSSIAAAWAASEGSDVGSPSAFATTDKALGPNQTLGVTMKITRKAAKQAGAALEDAVRRDMASAIEAALDKAVFLGAGSSGEPAGVLVGSYGITSTSVAAAATWSAFRAAVVRFMTGNAAASPSDCRLLIRPEVYSKLDGTLISGTAVSEWDRLVANIPASNIAVSANALAAPTGSPLATKALLSTSAGGVSPIFLGIFGGVDVIRDVVTQAPSGTTLLTGLLTADITVARGAQLEILTGVQT